MHSREDEINEEIEEQILLQNYFCESLQHAFSHFKRSNLIVQTLNSKTIQIAFGGDKAKTSSVCEIEELAAATKKTKQLEDAYAQLAKAKFADRHITLKLPKVTHAKYRANNVDAIVTLSTGLSNAALEREYFIEPQVLERLNSRQRLLLCDLICDQVATLLIPKSGGAIMEMYLSGNIIRQPSQQAVGNIISDCLKGNQLGMQNIGDFDPDKNFMQSLHNKAMCVLLLAQLVEAKNVAKSENENTKPYLTVIKECYKINQDGKLQPHEKFNLIQKALIHAIGDMKSNPLKGTERYRKSSLPSRLSQSAESVSHSGNRRLSEPNASSYEDTFTGRLKRIYDQSARLVSNDHVVKPSKTPSAMFSLKRPEGEEQPASKHKQQPQTKNKK